MSFPAFQTPARPLPGAYVNTPAPSRYPGQNVNRQLFGTQSSTGASAATAENRISTQQAAAVVQAQPQAHNLKPVQRAARTINDVLRRDAHFPELDSYVKQGISSDYEIPSALGSDQAWVPYQKTKMYDIPDAIFEQYNHAQVSTMMGLFAELNHAWMTIDNCLYLWDYTQTNSDLQGFEEQPNNITAVKLLIPRKGVFLDKITHLLVVATTSDIFLLGVGATVNQATGAKTVELFNTGMSLSIKGIQVNVIEGSAASGRIFFGGNEDNEIYELTYQQEEKWFASKCGKVNHTSPGYTSLMPVLFGHKSHEGVRDIVVDDSRNLLYTLSSDSAVRIFHMDSPNSLRLVVEKKRLEFLRDISHMITQSPLLDTNIVIVSISPISAMEAAKLHLMATTATGCRLYLSATRGYGSIAGRNDAPTSMQVQHIKFPPPDRQDSQPRSPATSSGYQPVEQTINVGSRSLQNANRGVRYPPGFFLCFVAKDNGPTLFLSAPDTGRIAAEARDISGQSSKYYEQGLWHRLDGHAEAVGLVTQSFSAVPSPVGFGNELAVQFDEPVSEIAILTNSGVHIFRRRRLVDIFAGALKINGSEQGLEKEMNQFIRHYGRSEATSAALAVACGQGSDGSGGDLRAAKVLDPVILESARKAFIDYGGRASLNPDAISDNEPAINFVRPSARHDGLAMYIARLIRSVWTAPVIRETVRNGFVYPISTIGVEKLRSVQTEIAKLSSFLEKNSSFIQGLAGPESLPRGAGQHEEIALQGEHQALRSLWTLSESIVEGISFVMMLFEERMDEVWNSLDDTARQQLRDLTYESLFCSDEGRNLGKLLVKVIVNINIASGSNVETVADALRRKCKSFCSHDDVLTFKAQELLKKASEYPLCSKPQRDLLNQSMDLFKRVAESLTQENLELTIQRYVDMRYYAGAIQLCLIVAQEGDRGNKAISWINDAKPSNDAREQFYNSRTICYNLIHEIVNNLDMVADREPEFAADGSYGLMARIKSEAYEVIGNSKDEAFHYDLYDYYLSQGLVDRLLAIDSDYIEPYLMKQAKNSVDRADLLWKFYSSRRKYYKAAQVQFDLAKSDFELSLKARIEYLSQAKANASTSTADVPRSQRLVLLREVATFLEIADIQDEIFQRIRAKEDIDPEIRANIMAALDGQILPLSEVSITSHNHIDPTNITKALQ